jgi:hypothetical protein
LGSSECNTVGLGLFRCDFALAIVRPARQSPAVCYDGPATDKKVPTALARPGTGFGLTAEDCRARLRPAVHRNNVRTRQTPALADSGHSLPQTLITTPHSPHPMLPLRGGTSRRCGRPDWTSSLRCGQGSKWSVRTVVQHSTSVQSRPVEVLAGLVCPGLPTDGTDHFEP